MSEFCLKNLVGIDISPVAQSELDQVTYKNACGALKALQKLDGLEKDDIMLVRLAEKATYAIPRGYPLPVVQGKTKWEEFAKTLARKKNNLMVFDENSKQWVRRYGYKGMPATKSKAMFEFDATAPPKEDPFEKTSRTEKGDQTWQELKELRNKKRALNVGKVGLEQREKAEEGIVRLKKLNRVMPYSTPSQGRFEASNRGEARKRIAPLPTHASATKEAVPHSAQDYATVMRDSLQSVVRRAQTGAAA